jgi:tRNA dimethylallyltransferase
MIVLISASMLCVKPAFGEEATALYPFRHLQTLQTVGYQEVFDCMDGKLSKSEAIDKIKQNSRNYAKRQMTWFKKDEEVSWFESAAAATQYLKECI